MAVGSTSLAHIGSPGLDSAIQQDPVSNTEECIHNHTSPNTQKIKLCFRKYVVLTPVVVTFGRYRHEGQWTRPGNLVRLSESETLALRHPPER